MSRGSKRAAKKRKRAKKKRQAKASKPSHRPEPGPAMFCLDPVTRNEWVLTFNGVPLNGDPKNNLYQLLQMTGPVREGMLQAMRADSCISSSRIVMLLARAMGLEAEVRSVRLDVYNPVLTRFYESCDWNPPADLGEETGLRLRDEGGHCLVVGADDLTEQEQADQADDGWNGHLVVVVEGRILIDQSFDQFNRPAKAIPIDSPFVGRWEPGWGTMATRSDGVTVKYRVRREDDPGRNGYLIAADWRRTYRIILNGQEFVEASARGQ